MQRHISSAAADRQTDIQTIRTRLDTELGQGQARMDTSGKLLGSASDTAYQVARQNEMLIGWLFPHLIPTVSFDQACAFLNVKIPYDDRRTRSYQLAVWLVRPGRVPDESAEGWKPQLLHHLRHGRRPVRPGAARAHPPEHE